MESADLVVATPRGLYCPAGRFYIDPWRPVETALITHAHADHLRPGHAIYHLAAAGVGLARERLTPDAPIAAHAYGEEFRLNGVRVSLHPAGHILGSAQIRLEYGGSVWVVSGDYKREPDPTCTPFEVLACDVFISEATFALPVYRWAEPAAVIREIYEWWQSNRELGLASVLFAYSLGKAQRVLAELAGLTTDTVYLHGAIAPLVEIYRAAGIALLPTQPAALPRADPYRGTLIVAPPGAAGSAWMRRLGPHRTGFCSGWMRVRGDRRRRGYDRGFVLSDHADWPSLLGTCRATGARRILLTHGHSDTLCRYLRELGVDAATLSTEYGAEQ